MIGILFYLSEIRSCNDFGNNGNGANRQMTDFFSLLEMDDISFVGDDGGELSSKFCCLGESPRRAEEHIEQVLAEKALPNSVKRPRHQYLVKVGILKGLIISFVVHSNQLRDNSGFEEKLLALS